MMKHDLRDRLEIHLHKDLLRFWDREEALGKPAGNFPTYRNNDGSSFDERNPSPEYMHSHDGLYEPYRDYVRMKSRQCFAYGLAYKLTNQKKYFDYMKKGIDYLNIRAMDEDGLFYSYFSKESNEWGPTPLQRTSQDIAYALCGHALYYSITNDKAIMDIIMRHINFILNNYYDKKNGVINWTGESAAEDQSTQVVKLVSVLDQVYSYLLCLAKCPENPYMEFMRALLEEFGDIMKTKFYWPKKKMFYGLYDKTQKQGIKGVHTDFGHSVKAFWMLYEVGLLLKRSDFVKFSKENISALLPEAFDEKSGSWGNNWNEDGSLNTNKEWWSFCILDQVAAVLSIEDGKYLNYLNRSLDFWFKYMVDHQNGGIWHRVDGKTYLPDHHYPKQHIWKNAFHEFEHVSIIYNLFS